MAGSPLPNMLRQLRRVTAHRLDALTDTQLLQAFLRRRCEDAFATLLRRHGPMVFSVCRRVLAEHDAEDAFQATFMVLLRGAGRIGRRDLLAGWLHGVACRVAARARARAIRRGQRERTGFDLAATTSQLAPVAPDAIPALHEEVQRLPAKYRDPIVLCYLQSRTHEEAARVLGWPRGTVAGRLARARQLLHRRLTRRGLVLPAAGLTALLGAESVLALPPTLAAAATALALTITDGAASSAASAILLLAEGEMHAMLLTKLKAIAVAVVFTLAVAAAGMGLAGGPSSALNDANAAAQPPPVPMAFAAQPAPGFGDAKKPSDVAHRDASPDAAWEEVIRLKTDASILTALTLSPTGKVIYGNTSGAVQGWEIATGKALRRFDWPLADAAYCVLAVSPDGKRLIGADRLGGARVWDLETGQQRLALEWRDNEGRRLTIEGTALAADGRRAVTGGNDGAVRVWDMTTGKQLAAVVSLDESVRAVALAPDGKWVAALTSKRLQVWNIATSKQKHSVAIQTPSEAPAELRWSADGSTLVGVYPGSIRHWDAETGIGGGAALKVGPVQPQGVALSPDGRTLATAPANRPIHVIDLRSGKTTATLRFESWPGSIAFSPDGRTLAAARHGSIRLWRFRNTGSTDQPAAKTPAPAVAHGWAPVRELAIADARALTFSPDRRRLAALTGKNLTIWDPEENRKHNTIDWRPTVGSSAALVYGRDGRYLAAADVTGVRVWDAVTTRLVTSIDWPRPRTIRGTTHGKVTAVALGPDLRRAATGTTEGRVTLWDLDKGESVRSIDVVAGAITSLAFSPDGKTLAASEGRLPIVRVWDLATGKEKSRHVHPRLRGERVSLRFAPDSRALALVGREGVTLWDLATGANRDADDRAAAESDTPLAFAADGRTLAVAIRNGPAELIDTATGKTLGRLPHGGEALSVAFAPDGRTLAVGVRSGRVVIWRRRPGK